VPDAGVVARMKLSLDSELRPILEKRADSSMPPARYWIQYIGSGSGIDKAIGIVGRPFPVPSGVDAVFLGAIIPEQCHVFASYLPNERRVKDVAVGGSIVRLASNNRFERSRDERDKSTRRMHVSQLHRPIRSQSS
jgi:hypothetical protein